MATIELNYDLTKTPESIRRWWLDFPHRYEAKDRREQPHRIITKKRTDDEIHVETWWRGPFNSESRLDEVLRIHPDGSWSADLRFLGFRIRDDFRAAPSPTGARLHIRSTVTPDNAAAKLLRPLAEAVMRRRFTQVWNHAVALCECDAE